MGPRQENLENQKTSGLISRTLFHLPQPPPGLPKYWDRDCSPCCSVCNELVCSVQLPCPTSNVKVRNRAQRLNLVRKIRELISMVHYAVYSCLVHPSGVKVRVQGQIRNKYCCSVQGIEVYAVYTNDIPIRFVTQRSGSHLGINGRNAHKNCTQKLYVRISTQNRTVQT